ncbi:hypothetical protein TTHERM_01027500 (macronuclear) [Tetrahymena thermophila SB210]|uniref:Cyclic nucleotide-binding domain protein n=1 Tax=Tetrahymena thermophila (strain SB210) TaxID=312017 RepID=Q22CM8_TETTS|nr:hypothetical protein TTHERM_01027500 [Tetrahymena thermophila SB210]EAR83024.1 hypothetical protein TTHERM_01027500 [Tetrahymena thermophila SB210]|eukprot:XP_001030687.1 hypothetical protein TTHERM_01027500 [Tetrahymena thermophila SB210]
MDFETIQQLLVSYQNGTQISNEHLQALRDKILCIREFQNLRKQLDGDNKVFDQCLKYLKYEFYPKNRLIFYTGQKKEQFYFVLEGSCGQFQQKEDSNINKEIHYFGILQELQSNLKQEESKLAQVGTLQEEQNTLYSIKILQQKISVAEATLQVYRKDIDQAKLKEAILSVEDKQLRHKLYQKHFQLNNLCLYTKEKVLISGDNIDQINLNGKDNKNTVITLEDSHIISINIDDYSRVFQHIVKQIQQSQKIMRNYFPDVNEEIIQFLSYEFTTHYFERNEVIYSQNSSNPQSFFILLQGTIEIRKYIEKGKKQQNCNNNSQIVDSSSNTIKQKTDHTITSHKKQQINNNAENQFEQQIVSEKQSNQQQDTQNRNTEIIKIGVAKQKEDGQKAFNVNDPFHSIIVYCGQQVFGTECHGKMNEYSAVSISTETKVIALDKKKFDLYDHQFNFRGFLKRQAIIQNKFYQERLQRLADFSKKMLDEQIKNKQLIQTQVKQNIIPNQISCLTNTSPMKLNQKDLQQDLLEQNESNNNVFDFQQKLHHQSIIKTIFSSQGQEISFKDLIEKLIQTRSNKQDLQINQEDQAEEIQSKKEPQSSQNSPRKQNQQFQLQQQHSSGVNRGFDFEMNDDKKRRTNILIDHKVKKQLNYKKIEKITDYQGNSTLQKNDQKIPLNSSNINNSNINNYKGDDLAIYLQKQKQRNQYVQREGQLPWLDQFGFRKEMEHAANSLSLNQIQKKIDYQNQMIKQIQKRNSQDLSPINSNRKRNSTLENINEGSSQTNFQNEVQQIPEKISQQKSFVNLDLINKQIHIIKSSISTMKEQDQQEQEQIQDMKRIFSTNSILLNRSQSNSHSTQKCNQELQSNLSQSYIANFNNEVVSSSHRSQSQNISSCSLNSPGQKTILESLNSPNSFVQQQRNREKIRKTKKFNSAIISNCNNLQHIQQQPNSIKSSSQINIHNEFCSQKEIPSLSIFSPLPKKQRALQSHHVEQQKTELPLIECTPSIKSQVNLLKKRNLIAENFSPSINTRLNISQKIDKSPTSISASHNHLLTDRLVISDTYKDYSVLHVKKLSENFSINSPHSCSSVRQIINRQLSQDQLTPSTLAPSPLTFSHGQQISFSNFKQKSSHFIR